MTEPKQIELAYGRQAPIWRRRKPIVAMAFVAAIAISTWLSWQHVVWWYQKWSHRREAARWYATAANWSEPATKLKYTEVPADRPTGKLTNTRFATFGASPVERLPFFNDRGQLFLAARPDDAMLLMHERTTPGGTKQLIAINHPRFNGKHLGLDCNQVGLFKGDYRVLTMGSQDIDFSTIAAAGQLRLFAGQADPSDPSKFSIPFEARGQKGFIDGVFTDGSSDSADPVKAAREREAGATVKLSVRMVPTSQPTTRPAK